MKRAFQILVVLGFLGVFSAPTFAAVYSSTNVYTVNDEPTKKENQETDTKTTENKETEKKSECTKASGEKSTCTKTGDKACCSKDKPACAPKK